MCTRVIWPDAAGAVLVGRNMDYHRDTGTNLWSLPRGIDRDDGVGGELTWTAKYGSLIAGGYDMMSVDGMNEAGLSGHILWLAESEYGPRDASLPALSMAVWLQYFLDNFATVDEAAAWIDESGVPPFRIPDPDKPYASQTLWQTVADLTNKRYVFESTTRPNIVWVDLDALDFRKGASAGKLDLMGDTALEGGLAGNVSERFTETAPMRFLTLQS